MNKRKLVSLMKSSDWRRQIRGFTLIEMMVVFAIVGIIVAIALPKIMDKGKSPDPFKQIKQKQVEIDSGNIVIHELDPGTYEIWLKDVNRFIKIEISEAGG